MILASADDALWSAIPVPVLILDRDGVVRQVNPAGESFLGMSSRALTGQRVAKLAGENSSLTALVEQVRRHGIEVAEYDVDLAWPDTGDRLVDLHARICHESGDELLVMIHPRSIAESMDRSLKHRNAARSVTGMAAMLAHEIKNPLSGISGAAQLLEMSLGPEEKDLASLIREEVERISGLLDRVEQFGAITPGRMRAVNIHDVLDRACKSAKAGFAAHLRFIEEYDPSLPPTVGDPDQLIQVMINLLKNAAEAAPRVGGVISVRTSFRAGMKVVTAGGKTESLPLQVIISDNGAGVPEDLQPHIFEPFVSSKTTGNGLGLALVSKIIADHGGIISCESQTGWTRFRMLFPVARAGREEAVGGAPEETAA